MLNLIKKPVPVGKVLTSAEIKIINFILEAFRNSQMSGMSRDWVGTGKKMLPNAREGKNPVPRKWHSGTQTSILCAAHKKHFIGHHFLGDHLYSTSELLLQAWWCGDLPPGLGAQTQPLTFVPGNHVEVPLHVPWLIILCVEYSGCNCNHTNSSI